MFALAIVILFLFVPNADFAAAPEKFPLAAYRAAYAMTIGSDGDDDAADTTRIAPVVEVRFERREDDLPPGVSLVIPGGGLVNNGFPALSADGARIAVFYHASHPLIDAYPTLDIYSSASLALQERVEFLPEWDSSDGHSDLLDPQKMAYVANRVQEVNRLLYQEGFRSIPRWFRFQGYAPYTPADKFGRRAAYGVDAKLDALVITTLREGKVELKIEMPKYFTEAENPENNCVAGGFPEEGWYHAESRTFILRVTFNDARDGCEEPEQWLLKRL